MYSVVLMIALTGSSDAVGFGRSSCGGCSGPVASASCSGSSCHGGGLLSRLHSHGCHGTTSGCAGPVATCSGSSCHGGLLSRHRSHGCHGTATCSGSSGYSGGSVSVGCAGGSYAPVASGCPSSSVGGVMAAPCDPAPAPAAAPAPAKQLPKS